MKRRYTVIEAAKVLGVGTDAVRKRVARGTVEHERVDETVYVWLDIGHDDGTTLRHDGATNGSDADLLDALRDQLDAYKDQVTYLRSSLDEEQEARASLAEEKGDVWPKHQVGTAAAARTS